MAVFLGFSLVFAGFLGISSKTASSAERGILGGPITNVALAIEDPISQASTFDTEPVLTSYSSDNSISGSNLLENMDFPAAIGDPGQPIGPVFSRDNLISYKIQRGDTLSGIAAYFGISLDTIIAANPGVRGSMLKAGASLNILPTSGIVYYTKAGDTLESISEYFNIPTDKIAQFNKSVNFGTLDAGISLVIPGAKTVFASSQLNSLPNFNANFIMPADGFNWGILHHYNAVDIAASCGTPVVAAAEGLVVPDENFGDGHGSWNGGYGQFVLIEHPFGTSIRTRYAHLSQILVSIGDYVKQGQEIGLMGQTGDATGCHVHFEVIGAQNPFAKS